MKPRTVILIAVVVVGLIRIVTGNAQATNPPYLSQFPSVDKVKAELKGSDALDTAAKQMGAFWQLREIIETLGRPRILRSPTPDENRLMGQYSMLITKSCCSTNRTLTTQSRMNCAPTMRQAANSARKCLATSFTNPSRAIRSSYRPGAGTS